MFTVDTLWSVKTSLEFCSFCNPEEFLSSNLYSVMQAFSLDFNLRSHMKTHSQENYHRCPYPECGKRFAHEYKLKKHIASLHEKVDTSIFPLLCSLSIILLGALYHDLALLDCFCASHFLEMESVAFFKNNYLWDWS